MCNSFRKSMEFMKGRSDRYEVGVGKTISRTAHTLYASGQIQLMPLFLTPHPEEKRQQLDKDSK